jgi:hypothetical protein
MKFKLNDRVIWEDDSLLPLKGTIIDFIHPFTGDDGIIIKWDNGRIIHYSCLQLEKSIYQKAFYYGNNDRGVGHVEIDLEYQRDKILNELGI